MIEVSFLRNGEGSITKVSASGHSGYGKRGDDIICASVSTLVQTAYLALKEVSDKTEYERDEEKAYFCFWLGEDGDRHDADVILRAMEVGLRDLASGYPEYIKLEDEKCL